MLESKFSGFVRWYTLINYDRNWVQVWTNKNFDSWLKRLFLSGHPMAHQVVFTLSIRFQLKNLINLIPSNAMSILHFYPFEWFCSVFEYFDYEKFETVTYERFLQVDLYHYTFPSSQFELIALFDYMFVLRFVELLLFCNFVQ